MNRNRALEELLVVRVPTNNEKDFWLPLQYFAAEDEGRTEDPTEQRLKKAREEGRVAKSQELGQALVLIFGLIAVFILARSMVNTISTMIRSYFYRLADIPSNFSTATIDPVIASLFFHYFLTLTVPLLIVVFIAALIGNLSQVGFLFTTKTLKVDFKKIVPDFVKYLKKTLFGIEAIYNFGKSLFKVLIIGFFAYFVITASVKKLVVTPFTSLPDSGRYIAFQAFLLMVATALVLLILAVVDYLFQRRQFREQMKMTKRDVKDEMKESYGNPLIKSRLRQRMMELLRSSMVSNVPKADVIVTNPTHFAVALQFELGVHQAPVVVAKGADAIAQNIKRIAKEHNVPIIENKPLARGLYSTVEVGQEIPPEYWQMVINILMLVDKISGKKKFRPK